MLQLQNGIYYNALCHRHFVIQGVLYPLCKSVFPDHSDKYTDIHFLTMAQIGWLPLSYLVPLPFQFSACSNAISVLKCYLIRLHLYKFPLGETVHIVPNRHFFLTLTHLFQGKGTRKRVGSFKNSQNFTGNAVSILTNSGISLINELTDPVFQRNYWSVLMSFHNILVGIIFSYILRKYNNLSY